MPNAKSPSWRTARLVIAASDLHRSSLQYDAPRFAGRRVVAVGLERDSAAEDGGGQLRPLGCPEDHDEEGEIPVHIAGDDEERHGEHQGAVAAGQLENGRQTRLAGVPGDAGEPGRHRIAGRRALKEDHAGQGYDDVEEKRHAGDPGGRAAGHLYRRT